MQNNGLRITGMSAVLYLSWRLSGYVQLDGWGALGSIGQYVIGLFFCCLLFLTTHQQRHWNGLFLIGLAGVAATF